MCVSTATGWPLATNFSICGSIGRIAIVGAGKAAGAMAVGAEDAFGPRFLVDESALTAHDCDEVGASRAGKGMKESTHGQPFGIVVAGGAVGGGGRWGAAWSWSAISLFFGMISFCP